MFFWSRLSVPEYPLVIVGWRQFFGWCEEYISLAGMFTALLLCGGYLTLGHERSRIESYEQGLEGASEVSQGSVAPHFPQWAPHEECGRSRHTSLDYCCVSVGMLCIISFM